MEVKTEEVDKVMETSGSYSVAGELEPRTRGRPTKYNAQMLERAAEYLKSYQALGDPVPTAAGLACELGVGKKTLYRWAEEHEDFRHMLDALNSVQERVLVSGSLAGNLNAMISKLMLAKQGYTEKQEVEHSASNGAAGGFAITWGSSNASG